MKRKDDNIIRVGDTIVLTKITDDEMAIGFKVGMKARVIDVVFNYAQPLQIKMYSKKLNSEIAKRLGYIDPNKCWWAWCTSGYNAESVK